MLWRRVVIPSGLTPCELHGVIQVAMGREGIHLYDLQFRAGRYGSREAGALSAGLTMATPRFREGAWYIYQVTKSLPTRPNQAVPAKPAVWWITCRTC
jgi:hypothetical protein